jgi:putative heme-binding domain-containing protein
MLERRRVILRVALAVASSALLAQQGRDASSSAANGRIIFEGKGACRTCLRVKENGSRSGPDLTEIAAQRTREALEKSLLDPNPEVSPQYRRYQVITRDGASITGKILNQDIFSIQMLDSSDRLRSFQKSNLRESGFVQTPPMPSYRGKLSPQELTDLLAYLATLKGVANQ